MKKHCKRISHKELVRRRTQRSKSRGDTLLYTPEGNVLAYKVKNGYQLKSTATGG